MLQLLSHVVEYVGVDCFGATRLLMSLYSHKLGGQTKRTHVPTPNFVYSFVEMKHFIRPLGAVYDHSCAAYYGSWPTRAVLYWLAPVCTLDFVR